MKAYKLFRKMKDGYAPLFIDATLRLQLGETHHCKTDLEKKGFSKRVGWHGCFIPFAPHLALHPKNGAERVWLEGETSGWLETYDRPDSQGGKWFTCETITLLNELEPEQVQYVIETY